jgi:two-component system CheB/CheR fusion protein
MPGKKPAKSPEPEVKAADAHDVGELIATGFPIVGIGASAGGLAAFEAFFSGMPPDADPGMAFVLVQHLAPDHKSILTDLVRRYTRMQVFEVEDGMVVEPNCTYIIPPNRDMAFINGMLQLFEPSLPRGQRLPIDFFFRSLARDLGDRAIAIVLSGTGGDGTLGIRAIKGEGGMAMAQSIASAEYDGMPRSAMNTGLVDYELSPAEMPARLIQYVNHAFGGNAPISLLKASKAGILLSKIFVLLRAQTGHDFSQYKISTIQRRIERRMAVNQIETMEKYVKFLQQAPVEVSELFRDFLIGVTNFFRDPDAFKVLQEQVVSRLFVSKAPGDVIRVWSTGCSTGEEAYSIAIMLAERQEALKHNFKVQIFATDIDSHAIAAARIGLYPSSISADVSPDRLARYFTLVADGSAYRIHKSIRDMVVFSDQNVTRDPPFSKLDIISCRNLLIYMGSELQKKLLPLFHYALNPQGFLFLGTSETVGDFVDLFAVIDRKAKLYQRKDDFHGTPRVAIGRFFPMSLAQGPSVATVVEKQQMPVKRSLRELTEHALLQQVAPACALTDSKGDILYLYGRTGMYLEPAPGEAGINNILKMAREGLRLKLTTALHDAVTTKKIVRSPGLSVKTNGHFTLVNLTIRPVLTGSTAEVTEPLYLVILEEVLLSDPEHVLLDSNYSGAGPGSTDIDVDSRIIELKKELMIKDEYLQITQEELESSNEELKSSNEEMQSVNEELQSTNEELETSKEELQSVNEELATINSELQIKVVDLSCANNDMNNLLAGTGIAIVFVDLFLHILRFTPSATKIINLILSDVGRPVSHIVSNLIGYESLSADVQVVLDTLIPKDLEVQTKEGHWYQMRIQPYRTLENKIEGAVITFMDIAERKQIEAEMLRFKELGRLAVVLRDASDAILVQGLDGRILAWNQSAVRLYGWSESEALKMNVRDLIPEDQREEALQIIHKLSKSQILQPHRTMRIAKDGTIRDVWITSTALQNEAGHMYAVATTERAENPMN